MTSTGKVEQPTAQQEKTVRCGQVCNHRAQGGASKYLMTIIQQNRKMCGNAHGKKVWSVITGRVHSAGSKMTEESRDTARQSIQEVAFNSEAQPEVSQYSTELWSTHFSIHLLCTCSRKQHDKHLHHHPASTATSTQLQSSTTDHEILHGLLGLLDFGSDGRISLPFHVYI